MRNRNWRGLGLMLLAGLLGGCTRPAATPPAAMKQAKAALAKDAPKDEAPAKPSDEKSLEAPEGEEAQAEAAPSEEAKPASLGMEAEHFNGLLHDSKESPRIARRAQGAASSQAPAVGGPPGGIGGAPAGGMGGGRGLGGQFGGGGYGGMGGMGGMGDSEGTRSGPSRLAQRDRFNGPATWTDRSNDDDGEFVPGGEAYERVAEKKFSRVLDEPLSTFSIDVDTASYANVRRFLNQHALPPAEAVRIEELVNYFSYDYAPPTDDKPFAANAEVAGCPWAPQHKLVRIGIKGKVIEDEARPVSNLVFLIDVSGSMQGENRLPLVKHSLRMLTEKLGENDRVAMVVYAGSSGLVLDSTSGVEKEKILSALDNLQAGGSTNGAGGIQQAYEVAVANFIKGGVNRVILCTDGDFNVGITDRGQLTDLIEKNAKTGVFLSVLGFGMGNLKDATMEQLADKGNGNYGYIDTALEAKKLLVEQMSGTLVTIAKDVKIQVEFNPAHAAAYRLVGYENRMLATEDFTDDKKDAGEIGAGHTVTALYEVIPAGLPIPGGTPELKYQKTAAAPSQPPSGEFGDELLTVKLRYKKPDGDVSTELSFPLKDSSDGFGKATADFRFAASVAAFGMLLRESSQKGDVTFEAVKEWAQTAIGDDRNGYRREFMHLVDAAITLSASPHLSAK